jgi:hypothetical protein
MRHAVGPDAAQDDRLLGTEEIADFRIRHADLIASVHGFSARRADLFTRGIRS